jgi:hypothetical protein
MSRSNRPFKDTQVFGWETEPRDERPSEFVPSTGYSALSGYYAMPDARSRGPSTRRRGHGPLLVLLASAAMIGLGVAALLGFLHLIRG